MRTAQPTGSVSAPMRRIHAGGQRQRQLGRGADQLGEGAGAMRAQQPPIAAELVEAGGAARAVAAIPERVHGHQRADGQVGPHARRPRADSHDLAGEFMPHNQRRDAQGVVAQVAAQFRAADAGVPHAYQDFVGGRFRRRLLRACSSSAPLPKPVLSWFCPFLPLSCRACLSPVRVSQIILPQSSQSKLEYTEKN